MPKAVKINVSATNICQRVAALNLRQLRLARATGIGRSKMNLFLNGNYDFTPAEIAKVEEVLNRLTVEHVRALKEVGSEVITAESTAISA